MDNPNELKQKHTVRLREHAQAQSELSTLKARWAQLLRERVSVEETARSLEHLREADRRHADLALMLDALEPDLFRLAQEVITSQRAELEAAGAAAQGEFERALRIRTDVENRFLRGAASAGERTAAEETLQRADDALEAQSANLAAFDAISIPERARQLVLGVAAEADQVSKGA